jgi:hypothetical protein
VSQPRGLRQCLRYNDAAARLRYTLTDDSALEVVPSSGSVACTLYKPDGTGLAAAANMTAETPGKIGFLKYDAQTVEFTVGEVVTGAGGSKGTIISQTKAGTAGVLYLNGCDGVFVNNEALTGSAGGAATADGVLFSCTYYLDVATSGSTTEYAVGEGYRAHIVWTTGSVITREVLFDIAYYPATPPLVSSQEIDNLYPTLVRQRKLWQDWEPAITMAHSEILHRVNQMGELAQQFIGRETDLWRVELDFCLAQIAASMGFDLAVQDRLQKQAEASWASLGPVRKSTDVNQTVLADAVVMTCKLVR